MESATILDLFARQGYATFPLPSQLSRDALHLAGLVHQSPIQIKVASMADRESGVLGYYPSEGEILEWRSANGSMIPSFARPNRHRGYSSFDYMSNSSAFYGRSRVFRENKLAVIVGTSTALIESVYERLDALSSRLASEILYLLVTDEGIAHDIERFRATSFSLLRLLNYRASESARHSKAHTDYEFLTLVISDTSGLQVKVHSRDWEDAPCPPGHAILLPGDMMEVASRMQIRSTLHRVRLEAPERRSVVFFKGPRFGFPIPPEVFGSTYPSSFGKHILAMTLRGAAHLDDLVEDIGAELSLSVPQSNPFRAGK